MNKKERDGIIGIYLIIIVALGVAAYHVYLVHGPEVFTDLWRIG